MKKILLFTIFSVAFGSIYAQDNGSGYAVEENQEYSVSRRAPRLSHLDEYNYKWSAGVEYSFPVYGVSLKYAFTRHSVLELVASPSSLSDGGNSYSFYGIRYIYRFPFSYVPFYGPFTVSYPYVFGAVGSLNYTYDDINGKSNTTSNVGYAAGVGYEWIFGTHIGTNIELGYGAFTASRTTLDLGLTYGVGLHYYFRGGHGRRVHYTDGDQQENINMDDQQDNNQRAVEDQSKDEHAPKATRKQRRHSDEDEE